MMIILNWIDSIDNNYNNHNNKSEKWKLNDNHINIYNNKIDINNFSLDNNTESYQM